MKLVIVEKSKLLTCREDRCPVEVGAGECPNKCPATFLKTDYREIADLPDGMPTEEAVKYIEHGREMVIEIRELMAYCPNTVGGLCKGCTCRYTALLTKLEGKCIAHEKTL